MYNNTFYPLRRIVSNLVPIMPSGSNTTDAAKLIFISDTAEALNYESNTHVFISHDELSVQSYYKDVLTNYGNGLITPGNGMDRLPVAQGFPQLSDNNSVLSIFGKTDVTSNLRLSRKLSVKYLITIDNGSFNKNHGRKPLIGGIGIKGYPYAQFEFNDNGENISNFGLPREVRITCLNIPNGDYKENFRNFLDEEITSIDQRITSHSGIQYICCDPTFATHIILELSDFPYFASDISLQDNNTTIAKNFFGVLIPYLFVFEYEEKTRYDQTVPFGFLGARRNGLPASAGQVEWSLLNTKKNNSREYYDFTAASIIGQRRFYELDSINLEREFDKTNLVQILQRPVSRGANRQRIKRYQECFISKTLANNEKVTLFFEQAEEFERCISGIRLLMPFKPNGDLTSDIQRLTKLLDFFFPENFLNRQLSSSPVLPTDLISELMNALSQFPSVVNICTKTRVRIFELDPLDGISPVDTMPDNKYSVLLADETIDTWSEMMLSNSIEGIKFKRTSKAKYFAIEFTNKGEKPSQIVVHSLKFIQSAHVSISSRASKTQKVKNLQFRIIGKGIADDYSRLGEEGFSFSIERQTAGKRGDILFKANSLLDLLHAGVGKIFSNSRRRGSEFEMVENFVQPKGEEHDKYKIKKFKGETFTGANVEIRVSDNDNKSWRRVETGNDVQWDLGDGPENFKTFSSSETRTHTEYVSTPLYDDDDLNNNLSGINNIIKLINSGIEQINILTGQNISFRFTELDETVLPGTVNSFFTDRNNNLWLPFNSLFEINNLPDLDGIDTLNINPALLSLLQVVRMAQSINNPAGINLTTFSELNRTLGLLIPAGIGVNIGVSGGINPIPLFTSTSGSIGASLNTNLQTVSKTLTNGKQGVILKSGQEVKYSLNQTKQQGYDKNSTHTQMNESELKRIVTRRELLDRDTERVRGAEILWQNELVDIITGTIPLNFDLPASASKMHFRTSDDTLRVRLGNGVGKSISVDFWFDINEEIIKDDY